MIIAGLMTGTSADGIDLVIAEFTHSGDTLEARVLAEREVPFDRALRADILRLLEPDDVPLSLVSSVDARLGRCCAESLRDLIADAGVTCDLVVSHGQTVRHDVADGMVTSTLQLGQPAWIAERTGTPVLSDVRARDIAAGGQGAPLVGMLDRMLIGAVDTPVAMLNLGGIANITVISPNLAPVAFDTGPANALIDILARRITDDALHYDRNGALAAQGTIDAALLDEMLAEPYYARPAPKSTGKELFHSTYLDGFLVRHDIAPRDALATVTELTARTVAEACTRFGARTVIAAGGGTRNPVLMDRIDTALGTDVTLTTTDLALGLSEGSKEALLMALIGWLSWHGLAGTEPSLTGATRPTIAGRLSPGAAPLTLPMPLSERPSRLRLR